MTLEILNNEIIASPDGLKLLEMTSDYLEARIQNPGASHIILEGAPPYLEPVHPTHQWDNLAFSNSWKILDGLRAGLVPTGVPVQHWLMIDDVHISEGLDTEMTLGRLQQSGIMSHADMMIMERQFRLDMGDECTTMDSRFQLMKFRQGLEQVWDQVTSRNINLGEVSLPLNIVIHPMAFQSQQIGMLPELLSAMKSDPNFVNIPKARRRELIERSYMHIWLDDESGDIVSVTQPVMNGGGFIHRPIFSQN